MDEDKRKFLYDQVSQKYDLGSFDEFSKKLDEPGKIRSLYDKLSTDFDIGDYNTFESKLKKKGSSEQESPSPDGTLQSARNSVNPEGDLGNIDVTVAPQTQTSQPQTGGEVDKGLLTPEPPQPYSPEQLNLQAQKAVLGKDIPTNMVDIAKITTDRSQLHNEAYAMAKQGKVAATNAIADIIIQKHPDDPYPYQLKAHYAEANGDYKGAVTELNNAISKSPNNPDLYYQRAILSNKAGESPISDADIYLNSVNKSGLFDEQTAFKKAQAYKLIGDEKNAEYQNYIYEGFKSDRQKNIDSQNLIQLSNWMGQKVTELASPISIPAMGIIEGGKKIVEGVEDGSPAKVASGIISAGFGVLMATPAGATFNSAIAAGNLVGASEVTDWLMAPFSKLNELTGVDESKFTDTGKLINEIANFVPLMLFMGGYHKTAEKFAKRLPFDEGDIRNLDEVVANATPEKVQEVVANMDKFKADREAAHEVSAVQKENPDVPTYRIGDKLLPKEEFVAEVEKQKEQGVVNPDVEVVGDPVTDGKVAEILEPKVEPEKEIPAEPKPEEPIELPPTEADKTSEVVKPKPIENEKQTKGETPEERLQVAEPMAGEVVAEPAVTGVDKLFKFYVDEPTNRGNYTPEFNKEFDKRATKLDKIIQQKEEIEQGRGNTGKNPSADKRKLADLTIKYNTEVKKLMDYADENAPKSKVEPLNEGGQNVSIETGKIEQGDKPQYQGNDKGGSSEEPVNRSSDEQGGEVKPNETKVRNPKIKLSEQVKRFADDIDKLTVDENLDKPFGFGGKTDAQVWNEAVRKVADATRTFGDAVKAVEDGVEYIKNTDWYKSLSDENKVKAEQVFREKVTPKEPVLPTKEQTMEGTGESREKSVLNRLVESENISSKTKKGLESKGLKYNEQSHEEARTMASEVIDHVGIDDAVTMAEAGKFGGGVNSLVFAESLDRLNVLEEGAKTPAEAKKLANQWAEISLRYDIASRESGRFVSAIQDYYKKSPLGMVVKENIVRAEQFKEWSKNKEKSFKEVFDEIISTEEGKTLLKDKFGEFQKEERQANREVRRQKIIDIFDKGKLDLSQMYGTVPGLPQAINLAIEGMKKATLAGESVLSVIETTIAKLKKDYPDFNDAKFKAYWSEKLKDIDKTDRKVPPEEQKLLTRIKSLEKAIETYETKAKSGDFKMKDKKVETDEQVKKLIEERDKARAEYQKLREQSQEWKERKSKQYLDRFRNKLKGLTNDQKEKVITRSMKQLLDNEALDYTDFKKIIAETIGLGELSPEAVVKMKDLVKKINAVDDAKTKALEDGTKESLDAFKKAHDEAELAGRELETMIYTKANPGQMFWNIVKLNTLGVVSLIRNVAYNLDYQPFVNFPKTALLTAYDYGIYGMTKGLSKFTNVKPILPEHNVLKAQGGFFKGFGQGVRRSLYQFKTGLQDKDYFSNEAFVSHIRPSRAFKDLLGWTKGDVLTKPQVIDKLMQTTAGWNAEFIARSLNLGDKPFRFGVERSTANQIARNEFKIKDQQALDMFHTFPKEEAYKYYKKQGLSDADAMEKAEYVQKKIVQAGERAVMQEDNFISKKVAELEKFIEPKDGTKNPLWTLGNQVIRAIRTLNMPYVKIPLNVAWNLYNLANPMMAFIQSAIYSSKGIREYVKGNKIAGNKSLDMSRDWLAHGVVGIALNAGTIYLISQGLINERGDDESKRQSGGESFFGRSNTINMSGLKRLIMGGDPALQDGDLTVDLQWLGIMGNLINVNANTETEKRKAKDNEDEMDMIDEFASKMKHSTVEALGNGVFSGTNNMIKAINQGGGYFDSWAINMINLGTNFIEPATYAQFSRAMLPEKATYKADSFWQEVKNNQKQRDILLRQFAGMPPSAVSMWGDPIKRKEGFKAVAYAMLGFNEQDNNKFGSILYQDFLKTKNDKFFPTSVPNTVTVNGKKVKLTVSEYMDLQMFVGNSRKNMVAPLLYDMATTTDKQKTENPYYSTWSEKDKVESLNMIYKSGYEDGLFYFIQKYPKYNGVDELKPRPDENTD